MSHPKYTALVAKARTREEQTQLKVAGACVLGVLDVDTGEPMFVWSQVDSMLKSHWLPFVNVATKIFQLSAGESIEELGKDSEPTPT